MRLEKGDLIFIFCGENDLDKAIGNLFKGYDDLLFNHVGIYIGNGQVVEAIKPAVRKVTLKQFFKKVNDHHKIAVGRTEAPIKKKAADLADSFIGIPYNETFLPETDSFYCSSLIHELFKNANNEESFFERHTLSFTHPRTNEIMPYWIEFYKKRGLDVPEGVIGSHPSNLSLDSKLINVFIFNKTCVL